MRLEAAADKASNRLDAIQANIMDNDHARMLTADFGVNVDELRELAAGMATECLDRLGDEGLAREAEAFGLSGFEYLHALFSGNWLHGLLTGLLAMREAK